MSEHAHRRSLALSTSRLSATVAGAFYMIAATACFATMTAIVRHLSETLHPFELAFFRNLLGALFLVPLVVRGTVGLRTERLGLHVLRALFGLAAMLCLFSAVALAPLAQATALTFTAPLFATLGAAVVLRETVRLRRWTATLVGFLGILVILEPGLSSSTGFLDPAALVALAAAAFMAAAMLAIKSLSRTETPDTIVIYFSLIITPLSLVPALLNWTAPEPWHWPWFLALGLTATLGQLSLARAFAAANASQVAPFDFFRLVLASAIAYVAFGEDLNASTWIGAAIVLASTTYITVREARLGRRALKDPVLP